MTSEPLDLDTLRHGARLAAFTWTDAELEQLRPYVDAALRLLRALEAIPVESEPTTHYRTV
jgi:Asp-tRNA(Asn)/Glu-tRNA(Gln) amidotransferase C subunit